MARVACSLLVLALAAPAFAGILRNDRSFGGRIVNGTNAPPGKYPAMVSYQSFGSHSCGGSILNENWVLTAAHCVDGDSASYINIYAGSVDLQSGGTRHQAAELIAHENYNSFTLKDDIALVRVSTPFVFSADVQPVMLPALDQDTPGGSPATLIGWGYPYSGGNVMQILQEVDYAIVSDQECMDAHSNTVFNTNICAYYPGGGKGQCSGDSGGPLWVNGQQVGIVSWSEKPCTVAPYPGVFTEVAPYIGWINSKIN